MKLMLDHIYPDHTPQQVWDVAISMSALHEVCAPLVVFDKVPREGRIQMGDHYEPDVRLFGRLPPMPYTMSVAFLDDETMTFQSAEHGGMIKQWAHRLSVSALGNGAKISETIEIDAGIMTPIYWLWGRLLYKHRHPRRLAILARQI